MENNLIKNNSTGKAHSTRFNALIKASFVAISLDVFLILLKYGLARLTGSAVLLADAIHSGGDFAVSLTVMSAIVINHRFAANKWARRAEGIVSLLISLLLIIASFQIFSYVLSNKSAIFILKSGTPLVIAFIGITIALVITFAVSRFKRRVGKKYDSIAFIAESMHTFSDFFTSFGVWLALLLAFWDIHIEKVITLFVGIAIFRIGGKLSFKAMEYFNIYIPFISFVKNLIPGFIREKAENIRKPFGRYFISIKSPILIILFLSKDWCLKHKKHLILSIIFLMFLFYIGMGFYAVLPYQTGVELLFGKVVEKNLPGLHFHAPKPFGKVILVDTGVATRLESGFRTNWDFEGKEPEVYLWEFSHIEGRYFKVTNEALVITGDENLLDVNFLCYYQINDPVQYALNSENAHEILRSLFCHKVHAELGHFQLDNLLTFKRGKVQEELQRNMKEAVKKLPLGVEIRKVYMREAHPPIEVVPQYRAVASAREMKDEIVHKANAYSNDLLPRSRGEAVSMIFNSDAFAAEKTHIAKGDAESFLLRQSNFNNSREVQRVNLWWSTVEKVMKDKLIYIFPSNLKRRIYPSEIKQEDAE